MRDIKKTMVTVFATVAVLGAAIGIYVAIHSPLFLVQVIEVADLPESAPVDSQTITQLAAVPTGIVNLFDLDLKAVERRILTNHWIREVKLQKRFPQTLSVSVSFREPLALFQNSTGTLSYIDSGGNVFGLLNLLLPSDLPLLSGFSEQAEDRGRIEDGLRLLRLWEKSPVRKLAQISTLKWDPDHGFRAIVYYGSGGKGPDSVGAASARAQGRALISLGQEIDGQLEGQLGRLAQVLNYLSVNSIPTRRIWADAGKKIVVKSARGS